MVVKVTRNCSTCCKEKPISSFGLNGKYVYSVCKSCKKLREAARKYGITTEQVKELYAMKSCMCCGLEFPKSTMQHIHHTVKGCKGVVCQYCNHILCQETELDLRHIEACLKFMDQPRKNLFNRDNPQGRSGTKVLPFPSTTTRLAHSDKKVCNRCKQSLPVTSFRKSQKWLRKTCKTCEVCLQSARVFNLTYEEVFKLYSSNICDCCNLPFTPKNFASIHHVGDSVLGITCNKCNRLLGQETGAQRKRLEKCSAWIKMMMI